MLGYMSQPEKDSDGAFPWELPQSTQPEESPTKDGRRVGLVVGSALLIVAVLVVVLIQIVSGIFGDMWHSVFTF